MSENIPMYSEVIKYFEEGKIEADGSIIECYFTEYHKSSHSVCWINSLQLPAISKFRKDNAARKEKVFQDWMESLFNETKNEKI